MLYSQYFEVYPNVITPATRAINQNQNRDGVYDAMYQYDSMYYIEAISAFNSLLKYSDLQNEILFYKGMALMSNGNYQSAKIQFQLMDPDYGSFINQRKWYLALVSLQLNELEYTEQLLNEIITDESSFSTNAKKLLNELSAK